MKNIFPPARLEMTVLDTVPFGTTSDMKTSFHALTLEFPPHLSEEAPAWKHWKAGQFVMLRPSSWNNELLWARPFSIARITSRGLVLFFQSVGRGTDKIATLKQGDKVVVWGPLGKGFAIEKNTPTLLIAGGIGIVPFCGYLYQHPQGVNLHMLFGHKNNLDCYPSDTIAQHIEIDIFHEEKPADLDIFRAEVEKTMISYGKQKGLVLACGPMPLLKYVWDISQKYNIRTQLSLENKMACGVGACLGCVAKTSQSWPDKAKAGLPVQTCTSGPVFWANDLDL